MYWGKAQDLTFLFGNKPVDVVFEIIISDFAKCRYKSLSVSWNQGIVKNAGHLRLRCWNSQKLWIRWVFLFDFQCFKFLSLINQIKRENKRLTEEVEIFQVWYFVFLLLSQSSVETDFVGSFGRKGCSGVWYSLPKSAVSWQWSTFSLCFRCEKKEGPVPGWVQPKHQWPLPKSGLKQETNGPWRFLHFEPGNNRIFRYITGYVDYTVNVWTSVIIWKISILSYLSGRIVSIIIIIISEHGKNGHLHVACFFYDKHWRLPSYKIQPRRRGGCPL